MTSFDELVGLLARLRKECPWDREQTFDTYKEPLLNEAREATDALEKKDFNNLRDELGDVLWNVIFIARLAEDEGKFSINDVMDSAKAKMIRRHPHVFSDKKLNSPEEVLKSWNEIKEKGG
ncbi:MAG: nucleotide pyrophosphohydrolase [Nanoarchaeota archaeon]|nr:nucleotide pyrophosphohydrolase [Nanoarchaeota archaeon]